MLDPYAQKLYDKKYRRKNKKIIKEKRHLRYLKNREKEIAKAKEYRAKNREKILSDQKKWRQLRKLREAKSYLTLVRYRRKNRDAINARQKAYRLRKKLKEANVSLNKQL